MNRLIAAAVRMRRMKAALKAVWSRLTLELARMLTYNMASLLKLILLLD
jgi:hypothetical protein